MFAERFDKPRENLILISQGMSLLVRVVECGLAWGAGAVGRWLVVNT